VDGGAVVATYAGKNFTEQDFLDELGKLNKRSRKALSDPERRLQFVENFILSALIYDEGVSKGFDKDPAVRKQITELERRLVIQKVMQEYQSVPVSEEAVRAFYDANPGDFRTDRVKASHILVKEEELAKEVHAKLMANSDEFATLAAAHSIDKSNAERGGDLGFFGRGRMVKEFEEAAFALAKDGQISDPVQTRFGYHIIMRTAREDGQPKPFEEVQNQIRIRLINDLRRDQTESFISDLKTKANYQVKQDVLAGIDIEGLDAGDDEDE
jgi:peptidyl-prolyl cis-trans isomerase C